MMHQRDAVVFRTGDEVELVCVFENTVRRGVLVGNRHAAAGDNVTGGEDTQQEMCLAVIA